MSFICANVEYSVGATTRVTRYIQRQAMGTCMARIIRPATREEYERYANEALGGHAADITSTVDGIAEDYGAAFFYEVSLD